MAGPSITDWISAVSTAALGVLGSFVTVWQWRRTGFSPKISGRIEKKGRRAIEVQIVNIGRAGGNINQIDIVTPGQKRKEYNVVDNVRFKGFPDETFQPIALPAMASMLIIIRAPAGYPFAPNVRIAVDVGAPRPKISRRRRFRSTDLGLVGLPMVLPPGTVLEPAPHSSPEDRVG
jgi:hypothetical protein